MKNKALLLLKQTIKNKTNVAKARIVELSLTMKSKKLSLLGNMSNKIHSILGQHEEEMAGHENTGNKGHNAIIMCNHANSSNNILDEKAEVGDSGDITDNKYIDLEHSMLEEDGKLDCNDQGGSVIDLLKNSKEEGQDFCLEDEIDNVADLFIKRFHKQIRMQKLESFKRYEEMLARSV